MSQSALNRRTFVKVLGTGSAALPIFFSRNVFAEAKKEARRHIPGINMALTEEEIAILNGKEGPVMAKILRSVVKYGDAFEAPYLVPIEQDGHWVTGMGQKGLEQVFELADTVIKAGLKAKRPFTLDPYPLDYENIDYTPEEEAENKNIFMHQKSWDEQTRLLGRRDPGTKSFSCTCYLPQVGNTPKFGQPVAWAESSAVVFANSVLGARCNRNSAPMEMLFSFAGKQPYFGFLTDEGRKADWLVEVKTEKVPLATLLGSAIGLKVGTEVPYVVGLDKFIGNRMNDTAVDYLKDFGAATASNGAVGLYHVDGLTPEAKILGKSLLKPNHKVLVVDDALLEETRKNYPVLWKDPNATPRYAFIGCPHLTLNQLLQWETKINTALRAAGKDKVAIPTILCASPFVLDELTPEQKDRMRSNGVRFSGMCGVMHMFNKVSASIPSITNSNKLRTYSTSRFYPDDELLEYIITGHAPTKA